MISTRNSRNSILFPVLLTFTMLMAGCNAVEQHPPTATPACADAVAIITAFYDANDAGRYDESLGYLLPDAALTTWAEGVNGRHWQEKQLTGREEIREVLSNRGLSRTSGQPDDPIFQMEDMQVSGDRVTFYLRPDRTGRDGKPYNPYRVEAIFEGCKIKSLTVIEFISWE